MKICGVEISHDVLLGVERKMRQASRFTKIAMISYLNDEMNYPYLHIHRYRYSSSFAEEIVARMIVRLRKTGQVVKTGVKIGCAPVYEWIG